MIGRSGLGQTDEEVRGFLQRSDHLELDELCFFCLGCSRSRDPVSPGISIARAIVNHFGWAILSNHGGAAFVHELPDDVVYRNFLLSHGITRPWGKGNKGRV